MTQLIVRARAVTVLHSRRQCVVRQARADVIPVRNDRRVILQRSPIRQIVRVGTPGRAGKDSGQSFDFTQASPATTWTINHNLGFKPAIELLDAGGSEFDAEVVHVSVNQALVLLNLPLAGSARCN